ncbi:DEAD/DEAH box helicase family protein [Phenylobacterium sp.]|uniref:DEAD/DEAH box helicase family protein n=1 Tax=Phenylobacterium sp. TaxID=1871053 RepID=UPI002ED8DC1C
MLSRMQFKGVWRDYQARVLEEIGDHLADGRLHVVAAPGAGKTILGLEIVRRLGRRALVFAPTVAIRDQWADRLTPLFLDEPPAAHEVSHQLSEPRVLTLATYQALDAFRRAGEVERLANALNGPGPLTLVLDEAHHLRREWWNGIEKLTSSLADVQVVSLTATPPYDATFAEWTRYEGVCGPIDLEIGIPELVRNGDLCPHQDHVILSQPTHEGLKLLDGRRRAIAQLQADLRTDGGLHDRLERHPWLTEPEAQAEAILETPEMLSAILLQLAGAGRRLPTAPLRLLGVSARELPPPSFLWLETFLEGVTGSHAKVFDIGADRAKALRQRLHEQGLVEGGRVRLQSTRSIFQLMASNLAKLDSISDIAQAEDRALGERLRMVVLSDHVRAGDLPAAPEAEFRPSRLGVVPIFEHLRRAGAGSGLIGVLTGTLVIVPRTAFPLLTELAADHRLDPSVCRAFEIPACPDHVRVELAGVEGARLVHLVTALFARGAIRILVGTQSLLGEGWDAPALNSLVLASNTASFMLSNQMRGRAIRIEPGNPHKVANIWHLATVEPSQGLLTEAVARLDWGPLMDEGPGGLSDGALLARRFRAFEGISSGDSTLIESGIGRLGLSLTEDMAAANRRTLAAAADRPGIARRWSASLGAGGPRARVRETAAPNYAPRGLAWADTLRAVVWSAGSAAAFAVADELRGWESLDDLGAFGMAAAGVAALASLPGLAKAFRLMWRNGSVEGSLEQVGWAVLQGLFHAGAVSETEVRNGRFEVRSSIDGRKDIVLHGVSRSTERQVMQAVAEVLGPVQNPRYLLARRSRLGWRTRTDYHAVPAALGAKKEWAERFSRLWNTRVGSSDLVYARTPEGRRVLLRARAKSLAAGFQRSVDRRSAWT